MNCGGDGCRQGRDMAHCNCWDDTSQLQRLKHGNPTGIHRPTGAAYRVAEAVVIAGLLAWLVIEIIEGLVPYGHI